MKLMIAIWIVLLLAAPAEALEIAAPAVPSAAEDIMPDHTDSFTDALLELIQRGVLKVRPDFAQACKASILILSSAMLFSLLNTFSGGTKKVIFIAGTAIIATSLILDARSMIGLATDTIQSLSEYGKLLFPVMTTALAAQGGIASSAALYTGTAAFDMILSSLITSVMIPLVYIFLVLSVGNSATGEELLKRLKEFIKNVISWGLKTILTVFTTYMSITGVVSGTTDAAALKATKVTISSVVPVVGGILSDASEAVLVSAGLMKNIAGVYGILAIAALFLEPFLRIGIQYLVVKASAGLCGIFAPKEVTGLIEDFAAAMGLLLAMTASVCFLFLISMVCFMKGVG